MLLRRVFDVVVIMMRLRGLRCLGMRGYVLPYASVADLMLACVARFVKGTGLALAGVAFFAQGGLLVPLAATFA